MVDAYNVLCFIGNKSTIEPKERASFVRLAELYAKKRNHKLEIIFDGGSFPWPEIERKSNLLNVVYVGYGKSADDFIEKYISNHKAADIVVASNDRQLCNSAARYGKASIGAAEFFNLLRDSLGEQKQQKFEGKAHKLSHTKHNPELDLLMEGAAHMRVPHKEEGAKMVHKRTGKKDKKNERILLKKIQKL